MPSAPYIPHDELSGPSPDADLAADICELSAFFSSDRRFLLSSLRNDLEIGEDEYQDVDDQNLRADLLVDTAAKRLTDRKALIGRAYPFELNDMGTELFWRGFDDWGKQAYLISLVLLHLSTVTPVLREAELAPDDITVRNLRIWFQLIATTVLAAELRGIGWAFGWPRPDKTGFLEKLTQIWNIIKDGRVCTEMPDGAPKRIKDGDIDVVAARPHADGGPGFPIAFAQVASGADWKDKSVRNTVQNVFFQSWFSSHPASQPVSYHIIPFTVDSEEIHMQTLYLGHILGRLRLSDLAGYAETAIADGDIQSEGTEAYANIRTWLQGYRDAFAT